MDIKRIASQVFNMAVCISFVLLLILIFSGIKTAGDEIPYPAEAVQPIPVADTVKEHELVMLNCVVIKSADTAQSEPTYSEAELEMLALVIYQEAGSDACSDETRMMVGNVVLNRVADNRFPDTMQSVLTEVTPSGFGAYGRLHWTGLVWPERASYLSEAHAVQRAYACAERLLNGERVFSDDVVFQAEFAQGTEVVAHQDGFYFCR